MEEEEDLLLAQLPSLLSRMQNGVSLCLPLSLSPLLISASSSFARQVEFYLALSPPLIARATTQKLPAPRHGVCVCVMGMMSVARRPCCHCVEPPDFCRPMRESPSREGEEGGRRLNLMCGCGQFLIVVSIGPRRTGRGRGSR